MDGYRLLEVGVIGFADERLSEQMCAVILVRPGMQAPTSSALVAFFRDEKHLAIVKLTERLIVLDAWLRGPDT